MQQGVLGGKMDGQPTEVLLNLYNQEKSRMDAQGMEGSYSSVLKVVLELVFGAELVFRHRTI